MVMITTSNRSIVPKSQTNGLTRKVREDGKRNTEYQYIEVKDKQCRCELNWCCLHMKYSKRAPWFLRFNLVKQV